MKQIADLTASTVESIETHIFAINPKLSYVPEGWATGDPAFWGQK